MSSQYQPQIPGWRMDLYKGAYSASGGAKQPSNKRLRFANEDYCEFSRIPTLIGRGRYFLACFFFAINMLFLFICNFILHDISVLLSELSTLGLVYVLTISICYLVILSFTYIFLILLLYILFSPRDCPVRFNRKTGKVAFLECYALQFGLTGPFRHWPWQAGKVTAKEYDWVDIYGVVLGGTAVLSSGGAVTVRITQCMVCKPGTHQVIDNFVLSRGPAIEVEEWQWICSFMASNDKDLDFTTYETGSSLAPAIKWPEDLDKKSKASSIEEYEQIVAQYNKNEE